MTPAIDNVLAAWRGIPFTEDGLSHDHCRYIVGQFNEPLAHMLTRAEIHFLTDTAPTVELTAEGLLDAFYGDASELSDRVAQKMVAEAWPDLHRALCLLMFSEPYSPAPEEPPCLTS